MVLKTTAATTAKTKNKKKGKTEEEKTRRRQNPRQNESTRGETQFKVIQDKANRASSRTGIGQGDSASHNNYWKTKQGR